MTAQVAFLFPGQGSQSIGMGADVFATSSAARQVFEMVDEASGFSLSTLCFQGPEETLRDTVNAQPAIVTVSLALLAAFQEPGQIVISGEQYALQAAMELAKKNGAKRVIPLTVSGAFHSPVMEPAAIGLAQAIQASSIQNAPIPIISNIHATPLSEAQAIRDELAQQIASPVQWIRTIEYMAGAGVTVFIEIGPGQALTGMVKRIIKGVTTVSISSAADIEKATMTLREMGLVHEV